MAGLERLEAQLDQLVVDGLITDDTRAALAADQGSEQLARLLRAVEQAGHSPESALQAAAAQRDFAGVRSPAQVLHHRITQAMTSHQLAPVTGADVDQIPAGVSDEWRTYLAALGEARDVLALGASPLPPVWRWCFGEKADDGGMAAQRC